MLDFYDEWIFRNSALDHTNQTAKSFVILVGAGASYEILSETYN